MVYFKKTLLLSNLLILCLLWTTTPAAAGSPKETVYEAGLRMHRMTPSRSHAERGNEVGVIGENLVYTVQPGDTLILIALRYNLNPAEIALVNNLSNPNLIFPGQHLILSGIAAPTPLPPATPIPTGNKTHVVQPGETIFSIANLYGVSVGDLITFNNISNPNFIYVGQTLQIPAGPPPTPGPLMPPFQAIEFSKATIIQGQTLVIKVTLSEPATLSGTFQESPIFFYGDSSGQLWALIAIHALLEPNTYPIALVATLPDGREVPRLESVTVVEGPYGLENIQLDESRNELLNADLIALEREKLVNLWSQVSLRPRWEGAFRYPIAANPPRLTSYFGTRRSYNSSEQLSFHGGTDFGGGIGTPIYAPAAGTVALAEPLTVRGNAVLIDHGMGLYSGYWHQDQIAVAVGQEVQAGDLIGYMGNTGLVTGPHLHWELRLNGIAVDPLQWVRESIP